MACIRTFLAAFLLSVSLLFSGCSVARVLDASPRLVENIQPLRTQDGQTFCTAFAINQVERLWATAGHCADAAAKRDWEMRIAERPATAVFVKYDATRDYAILQAEVAGRPLLLANVAPQVDDVLVIKGFPYGLPALAVTRGTLAAKSVPIPNRPISDVLDITVAGGNSGSPVLKDGKVVGILWGGFLASPHSLSIPWETLRRELAVYWEQ
jgi:S1-C subfamily serine protease